MDFLQILATHFGEGPCLHPKLLSHRVSLGFCILAMVQDLLKHSCLSSWVPPHSNS